MKPDLQYRPKARVAQRKERSLPKRKSAITRNGKAVFDNGEDVIPTHVVKPPSDSTILSRIREKTRLRVQKHREKKSRNIKGLRT